MTGGGYKNAASVLPPDLLAEVQKHFVGRLWVPKGADDPKERNRLIRALLGCGVATAEVAELSGLTQRRVQQIKRRMREEAKLGEQISD